MNGAEWKKRILEKIVSAAREGRLLYYEDVLSLAPEADGDKFGARRDLYEILDDINESTDGLELSSLVVDKRTGMPGPGFFRKYEERFGSGANEDAFLVFARLAREIFKFYSAPKNCGVLIDSENASNPQVAVRILRAVESKGGRIVFSHAYGNNPQWEKSLIEQGGYAKYFRTPKLERGGKNAADFNMTTECASLIRKLHDDDRRLVDILVGISSDKPLMLRLRGKAKEYEVEVLWFDGCGECVADTLKWWSPEAGGK